MPGFVKNLNINSSLIFNKIYQTNRIIIFFRKICQTDRSYKKSINLILTNANLMISVKENKFGTREITSSLKIMQEKYIISENSNQITLIFKTADYFCPKRN